MTQLSVRGAFQDAAATKTVPKHDPRSLRSLADAVGVSHPIFVRELLKKLSSLPPQSVIFSSKAIEASSVSGSAQIGLTSNGFWSFRGSVHEGGAFAHNYVLAMALLDLKNAEGKTIIVMNEGAVHGDLTIGSKDDTWQQNGRLQLIADEWDTAKNSRVETRLHVSTDPLGIVEGVVAGLFIAAGITVVAILGSDPETKCTWDSGVLRCE